MLSSIDKPADDPILALMQEFREDPRENKIDLGVGVYKDAAGETAIMGAIKKAEKVLHAGQNTKTYVGMTGDAEFNAAIATMIFGDSVAQDRVASIQAPGGGGALRLLADLILQSASNDGDLPTIWVSAPTWGNHHAIFATVGLPIKTYPYLDYGSGSVLFDEMMSALTDAARGDVVLLHGCCHNPSGAELTLQQWEQVTDIVTTAGLVPFIDLAYQGFGAGLEEDVTGLRLMAAKVPEMLVASSCSKNFAIYRERTGCALVLGENEDGKSRATAALAGIARTSYSMPPDHGASLVKTILTDVELRCEWENELSSMRDRVNMLRSSLADELRKQSNSDRFDFLADHRGMFSLLGITPEQVAQLKQDYGIYIVQDGRVNIAGLQEENIPTVARALVEVCAQ